MPTAPAQKSVVAVASTGKDAEKFTKLAIAAAKPKQPKVVMSLTQGGQAHASLPDLKRGDRLLVSAELELTADHEVTQSDSAGVPYQFEPNIEVSLLLAASPSAVTPGAKAILLKSDGRTINHRRHHDVVVFDNVAYDIGPGGLPWTGPAQILCTIAAWHRSAKTGQVLIIGQNEPTTPGRTVGDMSSISVARIRPAVGTVPVAAREAKEQVTSIPVVINDPQKRCVYSRRLDNLKAGEQIRIRAGLKSNCRRFGYSTRTTLEVFLADTAVATESGKEARRICPDSPQFCRGNGKNTLPEDVAMDSAKAGVLRITKDARQAMFVNVAVTTGDPLKKATRGNHSLDIVDGGFLAVTRYSANLAG